MCSTAEDSDATVCGEEAEEEEVHSPTLMETGKNAGLPGLGLLGRAGPVLPLESSRQDRPRDEEGGREWEELSAVQRALQSVRQTLQALQLSLNTEPPQLQEAMGGLKEVSRQLKQAQEGVKACAASATQERGKQVREVAQELSACMKGLAHLTGVVKEKLSAGVPSSTTSTTSSTTLVHDSSAGEGLSQEIPLQGFSQPCLSSQGAPPPSVHAHQSRAGMAALQPAPLVTRPPPPGDPARLQKKVPSGPTLSTLLVAQAPTTAAAPPSVAHNSITAHVLSTAAGLSGPACRWELLSTVPSGATSQPSGAASQPSGAASQPSGAASQPSGAASQPSGAASQPSGSTPQPANTHPQPGNSSNTSCSGGGVPGANPSQEGSGSKSAEFAETVPLQMLIREGLLRAGLSCLSTMIMGVKFVASLTTDGSLSLPTGQSFQQPHLWVNACWEKIGHRNKRTKKTQAYKMVFYQGNPLIHFCQLYNRSKVTSYLQESSALPKTHHDPQLPPSAPLLPPTQRQLQGPSHPPTTSHDKPNDITALLACCRVVPVREEEVCPPCYLPEGFWDVSDHVPDVEWFSADLEWN